MKKIQTTDLLENYPLPYSIIVTSDRETNILIIKTPHKGDIDLPISSSWNNYIDTKRRLENIRVDAINYLLEKFNKGEL